MALKVARFVIIVVLKKLKIKYYCFLNTNIIKITTLNIQYFLI